MSQHRVLQNLLRAYEPQLRKEKLPLHQRRAVEAVVGCRTERYGHTRFTCESGHGAIDVAHSCHHRSCRSCAKRAQHQWVESQQRRLLACPHFHVVFTLPSTYRVVWQYNRELMSKLLFDAARDTLTQVLGSLRFGGYSPGIIATLHTWGRQMNLHPHIHCLVTAGGLSNKGTWKESGDFLAPGRVLRQVYRAKVQSVLKSKLRSGELLLPPSVSVADMLTKIRQAYLVRWNVRVQTRYEHGKGVMLYLSRYIKGGPIRGAQITRLDAQAITFRYRDHRSGRIKTRSEPPAVFIRRWLEHVPIAGSHTVRHFGLYAGASRERRNRCRKQLDPNSQLESKPLSVGSQQLSVILLCKTCLQPMVLSYKTFGPTFKKAISLNKHFDHRLNVQQEEQADFAKAHSSIPP